MRIGRCLIDANWGTSTDVVYQFCRQSAHAAVLFPSHGRYVGASSTPFAEYKKKNGDRVGLNWRIPNVRGRRAIRHPSCSETHPGLILGRNRSVVLPRGVQACARQYSLAFLPTQKGREHDIREPLSSLRIKPTLLSAESISTLSAGP